MIVRTRVALSFGGRRARRCEGTGMVVGRGGLAIWRRGCKQIRQPTAAGGRLVGTSGVLGRGCDGGRLDSIALRGALVGSHRSGLLTGFGPRGGGIRRSRVFTAGTAGFFVAISAGVFIASTSPGRR